MCRMLIATGNVDLNPLFEGLIEMARDQTMLHENNSEKGLGSWTNPDGWGIAFLQNGEWNIHKSLQPIFEDPLVEQFRNLNTTLAIIHARYGSVGNKSMANTHPFQKNEFVFCHNGTIEEAIPFSPEFTPRGSTDSEQLFYSILTNLQTAKATEAIKTALQSLNNNTSSNFIFSNKEVSFIAIRKGSHKKYLQMSLGRTEEMVVVSSEIIPQLQEIIWEPLEDNQTIALHHTTLTTYKEKKVEPQANKIKQQ